MDENGSAPRRWLGACQSAIPRAVFAIALVMAGLHVLTAWTGLYEAPIQRGVHLAFALVIVFLLSLAQKPFGWGRLSWSLLLLGVAIVVSWLRRETRMMPGDILKALSTGAQNAVGVAIACAGAGIVIGVLTQTGLGLKLSHLIVSLSGGMLPLALALTAFICLLLGLGLPTSAAYLTTAILGAPALIELGVSPLAAHLFIFYFAVVSGITPPVAIAAFAAAGIADAGPMRTALAATRLGVAAYIIPFMFVYGPPLLLEGSPAQQFLAIPTALLGILMLAAGVSGWALMPLTWIVRGLCLAVALVMITPGLISDLIGLGGLALFVAHIAIRRFRQKAEPSLDKSITQGKEAT